jgi:hypothetical protein
MQQSKKTEFARFGPNAVRAVLRAIGHLRTLAPRKREIKTQFVEPAFVIMLDGPAQDQSTELNAHLL